MSEATKNLQPYPAEWTHKGLRLMADTLEKVADLAQQRSPAYVQWVRDNAASIETTVELAEQLLAAARRCRHAMRRNLKDGVSA